MNSNNKAPSKTAQTNKSGNTAAKSQTSGKTGAQSKTQGKATDKTQSKSTMEAKASTTAKTQSAEFAADSSCCMTDKDIISDILGSQKSLVTLYSTALCESSCKNMRQLVSTKLTECACDQFDMFLYMNERGMYPTEPAPAQKVQQAKQMYANKSTAKK